MRGLWKQENTICIAIFSFDHKDDIFNSMALVCKNCFEKNWIFSWAENCENIERMFLETPIIIGFSPEATKTNQYPLIQKGLDVFH